MKQIARLILLLAFSLFFSQAASAQITIEWEDISSGFYYTFEWILDSNDLAIGGIQHRRFLVTSGSGYIDVTATLDTTGNSLTTRMWVEEGIEFRAELKLDFVGYPPTRAATAGESCWTVIFDSEAADVPGSSTLTSLPNSVGGWWCPTAAAISAQVDEVQLNASDGTFTDHVRVTWNEVEGATAYQIFRCTTESEDSCGDAVGSPDGNGFDDYDGIDDVYYWYRVKACTGGDCGDFSEADEGYRSDGLDDHGNSCVAATPVTVNSTTSGVIEETESPLFFDKDLDYFSVELLSPGTLTVSSSGTTSVRGKLWDTECNSIATIVTFNGPNFLISEQLAEGDYFVSVEGVLSSVIGPYQFVSSFEPTSALPEAPPEVSASDGAYYNGILVSWSEVNLASAYNIYISDTLDSSQNYAGQITANLVLITGSEPGVIRYIWIYPVNANGESITGNYDTGYVKIPTVPDAPTLTSAEPGHQSAMLNFTANLDGGSAITGYTASCGAFSQAGSSSPITVGGLTNGVEYSCSVIATNAEGDSPSSNVLSVTPIPKDLIFSDGFEAKTN